MQNIYLLQFNNYMNRQYKPLTNDALASAIATYTNINFIENDGINTEVILNRNYLEEKNADYLVAVSTADATDYSAWFIMGSQRLRNGQVKYKLKADLVAMN